MVVKRREDTQMAYQRIGRWTRRKRERGWIADSLEERPAQGNNEECEEECDPLVHVDECWTLCRLGAGLLVYC